METKLTLKLDHDVINMAKIYAENNNRSLSRLVEDYFRKLISEGESRKRFSPLVEELSGVIPEDALKGVDYVSYLEEKYE